MSNTKLSFFVLHHLSRICSPLRKWIALLETKL